VEEMAWSKDEWRKAKYKKKERKKNLKGYSSCSLREYSVTWWSLQLRTLQHHVRTVNGEPALVGTAINSYCPHRFHAVVGNYPSHVRGPG
jgi:hypothetical protein